MYPEIFNIATPEFLQGLLPARLVFHSYGLMIALGMVTVYQFCLPRVKKYNVDATQLTNLFYLAFASAFIGGKVFYYLQSPQKYINNPQLIFKNLGSGFVFYGSLLFTVPAILFWLKRKKIPLRGFLDILAFVGPIIHTFGRMGCFLVGCCYGKQCDSGLGITFTNTLSKAKPLGTPLYPTQLFDIAVNLSILAVLYFLNKQKKFEGQLFLVYLMMYAVGRSVVEVYRGDAERGFVFGPVSHSQFIAILMVLGSLYFYFRWGKDKN